MRVLPYYRDPILPELIAFGRKRSVQHVSQAEIDALIAKSLPIYDALYEGGEAPPPPAVAISCGGSVAYTASAVSAGIEAAKYAAWAIGEYAAEHEDEMFDEVRDAAMAAEEKYQAKLLKEFFHLK
jgi:hypothetical protein